MAQQTEAEEYLGSFFLVRGQPGPTPDQIKHYGYMRAKEGSYMRDDMLQEARAQGAQAERERIVECLKKLKFPRSAVAAAKG